MMPSSRIVESGSLSSPASAAAVIVLPDPGGPTSRILRLGLNPFSRSFVCWRCSIRMRCKREASASGRTISERRVSGSVVIRRPVNWVLFGNISTGFPVDDLGCLLASSIRFLSISATWPCPCRASWAAISIAIERNSCSSCRTWLLSKAIIWRELAIWKDDIPGCRRQDYWVVKNRGPK